MIIVLLILLGLCFGSFIDALTWRIHEQQKPRKKRAAGDRELSMTHGRSMCTQCHHTLAWYDLLPLFSWLSLGGKCRYCKKPIGWGTPAGEIAMAGLMVASYIYWPVALTSTSLTVFDFIVWLVALVMLGALAVYDIRWMLLPNRIVYPLIGLAVGQRLIDLIVTQDFKVFVGAIMGALVGGGIFWVLYQVSDGKWIGGGDVKLGYALGLFVGSATQASLLLFGASVIGILVALPGLISGKFKRTTMIPFGPSLILACIIVKLFGPSVWGWYMNLLVT